MFGFSPFHQDLGPGRTDYRQNDPYGVGSLQVVVNPSGVFEADVDRFNAYDVPIGTALHNIVEVVAPRVASFIASVFGGRR